MIAGLLLLLGAGGVGTAAAAQEVHYCGGLEATMVGGPGRNNLVGTNGDDVIVGLGGNDRIRGRGGDDVICGGLGNDNIDGGTGDDIIYGEGGRDIVRGRSGEDFIDGGIGNDNLKGDNDDDVLLGGGGIDKVLGGSGNDEVSGGEGNDRLSGNNGDDVLRGDGGSNNRLDGGSGDDDCDVGGGGTERRCEAQPAPTAASVGDFVWVDLDGDGIQNPGEPGLAGVELELRGAVTSDVIATTTSDTNGAYRFEDVDPGDYRIWLVARPQGYWFTQANAGVDDTVDSDLSSTRTGIFTVAGTDELTIDLGFEPAPEIRGAVFADTNGNGVRDPDETGVPPERFIEVYHGAGNLVRSELIFGDNFSFILVGQPFQTYTVRVVPPPGWGFTTQDAATTGVDSDVDPVTGEVEVTPTMGMPVIDDLGAGLVRLEGAITGQVWLDQNRDGERASIEPSVSELTVELIPPDSFVPLQSTTTDALGRYGFTGLAPGDYRVRPATPVYRDWTVKDAAGVSDALDSDIFSPFGESDVIVVGPGEVVSSVDGGLVYDFRVSGTTWEDDDRDGNRNSLKEDEIRAEVHLLDEGGQVVATVLSSSSNGSYDFDLLDPGIYQVEFQPKEGYDFTPNGGMPGVDSDADPVTGRTVSFELSDDDGFGRFDAGYVPEDGAIVGQVWLDENRDGERGSGEPDVTGLTVELVPPDSFVPLDSTTTDGRGRYAFAGLVPGEYRVRIDRPVYRDWTVKDAAGVSDVADSEISATFGESDVVVIGPGEVVTGVDGGLVYDFGVSGRTWEDEDRDGNRAPFAAEDKIRAEVHLLDEGGQVLATTLSSMSSGGYRFDLLDPGIYQVEFQPKEGYDFTPNGGMPGVDSAADPVTGRTVLFELSDDDGVGRFDAGYVLEDGVIGNLVWLDENENGVQDRNEPGIDGVTVELLDPVTLNVIDTKVTELGGLYKFTVPAGDYRLRFLLPDSAAWTTADAGDDDTIDSDVGPDGTVDLTLGVGETISHIDAGLIADVVFSGMVWEDLNGDGFFQSGVEPPIGGVLVELLDETDTVIGSAVTGTSAPNEGEYAITVRSVGTFRVRVTAPAGFVFTDAVGPGGSNVADTGLSDDHPVVPPGAVTVDAGLVALPGSIGDRVWLDGNGNGIQDAGEEGVSGVRVELLDVAGGGSTAAVATTDADGRYRFDDVPARTAYAVAVELPDPQRFAFTTQAAGGDPRADSDVSSLGQAPELTLAPGEINLDVDAGLVQLAPATASIGDRVWLDENGDGAQDPGEPGIANVTVRLLDDQGNQVATATTDGDGRYGFTALAAGTYRLEFPELADRERTATDQTTDDLDSDANTETGLTGLIVLADGEADDSVDAGYVEAEAGATVTGQVWSDTDRDGIRDPGEQPVEGATVVLFFDIGTSLIQIASVPTGPDGTYTFGDLPPDRYVVEMTVSGASPTLEGAGSDESVDSDIGADGRSQTVEVRTGEVATIDGGFIG
ncbi:MAG: SdrD B-like domain-containing protein [Actinomycetota bacterium]